MFVCSAGVGRTGVFITLSTVLERMQYEGVVDVFQTVRTLRTQRPAMVQTEVRAVDLFKDKQKNVFPASHNLCEFIYKRADSTVDGLNYAFKLFNLAK